MTQRDDLVSELRQQARNRTVGMGADAHVATAEWRAATVLEAKDAEIARLTAARLADQRRAKFVTDACCRAWETLYNGAKARIAELERQLAENGGRDAE